MARSSRHSDLLGMNEATAYGRLRKHFVLHLLRRLGEDNCFNCGRPIGAPEDLSLEHKRPWRDVNADLFWDMENVTASHISCNKVDRPARIVGPEGTSWCAKCRTFVAIDQFYPGKRWNGLSEYCAPCHRAKVAAYASKNPRHPCPQCGCQMRKKCSGCGYEMPMKDYMRLRRSEGVKY